MYAAGVNVVQEVAPAVQTPSVWGTISTEGFSVMEDFITLAQTARRLADHFERQAGKRPAITAAKVKVLVEMGLLTNHNQDADRPLVSAREVDALADNTVYLTSYDHLDAPVFRVSMIHQRENPVYSAIDGQLLREYSGFDYSNESELSELEQRGGYEGVWSVSDENADYLVDEGAYLIATSKGYVAPGNIRKISSWEPIEASARKYFHTDPISEDDVLAGMPGQGWWIDVPPGRESDIDYDPNLVDEEPVNSEAGLAEFPLDELIRLKRQQIAELDELIALKKAVGES